MDAVQVCTKLLEQFDHTTQNQLAIIGSIALNVVILIRMWLTARENAMNIATIKRKVNGG